MHARIAHTAVDPDQYEAARKVLETEVLPRVRQIPGVVAGYWFEPVDGKGLNVIVCESKEVAAMPVPNAQPGESPAPGVTVESVEIREVIGQDLSGGRSAARLGSTPPPASQRSSSCLVHVPQTWNEPPGRPRRADRLRRGA